MISVEEQVTIEEKVSKNQSSMVIDSLFPGQIGVSGDKLQF